MCAGPPSPREVRQAPAGYGREIVPPGFDLSYTVVRAVGYVEGAGGVKRDIAGEGYRGMGGGVRRRPWKPSSPVPATVVMMPVVASTMRMRELRWSAM